ncbi:MAG: glutamine amidotransferase family protein [Clostridiales bacterium]|jgi:glutamate synthase domain-containing protein 1|nr:glutamine amidotransferase family protein [Clostridiales bacterium]
MLRTREDILEGRLRIPSGCAISGIFSKSGKPIGGERIIKSIEVMHDRSNGLGGGFACYGIYPQFPDHYAIHVFHDNLASKRECEDFLLKNFDIASMSEIPTRLTSGVTDAPLIWRYFAEPLRHRVVEDFCDEDEFVARRVTHINARIDGSYVFSSGKNMGVFKAIGFPEDVGRFYRLEDYEGYCMIAHGRYPTNTPGWWGGAHPFALLSSSVVHNGEISSYDANRRSIEPYGYSCSLQTDTEVIAYIYDYLTRRVGLSQREFADVVAAPFWSAIADMPKDRREYYEYIRAMFSNFLITGPFSIIVGFEGGMMALNDRLKLRSMVCAERGDTLYAASEECAIRVVEPELDRVWAPAGGEPVIATLGRPGGER